MKGLEYLHVPSDEISSTDWNPNHHYYWAGIGQHGFNWIVPESHGDFRFACACVRPIPYQRQMRRDQHKPSESVAQTARYESLV